MYSCPSVGVNNIINNNVVPHPQDMLVEDSRGLLHVVSCCPQAEQGGDP